MKLKHLPIAAMAGILLTAVASEESQAGAGYWFKVTNDMTPSKADGTYPRITLHEYGGWTCWYPNDIGNWNAYAQPGNRERPLYTEATDSLGCFFKTSSINFAVFIQPHANAPWVRVGHAAQLWNDLNANNGFYINPPLPWNDLPFLDMCGLKFLTGGAGYAPGTNVNYVKVSGKPQLEGCEEAFPNTGFTDTQASLRASLASGVKAPDVSRKASDESFSGQNVKKFRIKVGQTRTITLPALDPDSTWELDGGRCQGDHAFKSDLRKTWTGKRTLPHSIRVKATGAGQRICDITAYHNPERTILQKGRVILIAR